MAWAVVASLALEGSGRSGQARSGEDSQVVYWYVGVRQARQVWDRRIRFGSVAATWVWLGQATRVLLCRAQDGRGLLRQAWPGVFGTVSAGASGFGLSCWGRQVESLRVELCRVFAAFRRGWEWQARRVSFRSGVFCCGTFCSVEAGEARFVKMRPDRLWKVRS
jgi:hypothetical protein